MNDLGKILVIVGVCLIVVGALLWSGIGKNWLGHLPGDLNYTNQKGNFSFHFPIVTCIVVSILLNLILRLFRK